MARTYVEDDAFNRASIAAEMLKTRHSEVMGTLLNLWHNSQSVSLKSGTFDQIILWSRISDLSRSDQERWISVLCVCCFLDSLDDNKTFCIRGNEKHILALKKQKEKSQKGASATQEKYEKEKEVKKNKKLVGSNKTESQILPQAGLQAPATSLGHKQGSLHYNALHNNAVHNNSIQSNSIQSNTEQKDLKIIPAAEEKKEETPPTPPRGSDGLVEKSTSPRQNPQGLEVWSAYQQAFWKRYGFDPVRNATVNAQCLQLAKRLGKEAPEVVKFYLSIDWHEKGRHSLGVLVQQAEKFRADWKLGHALTSGATKSMEVASNNTRVLNELLEKFKNEREGK